MFERPILIYSDYCNYSLQFNQILEKYPSLFETFVKICVDADVKTQQRPSVLYDIQYTLGQAIKEVPTIIIKNGEYVLSGEEAFKWLEYTINENNKKELQGFNPNEMGAFSDSYASLAAQGLHDATEQTFKFINTPHEKIKTPPEDIAVKGLDLEQKQRERDAFEEKGNGKRKIEERSNMNWRSPDIDFTKKGFFDEKNDVSAKQRDVDARLQELISQRENGQPGEKTPRKVDFTTGEFY